MLKYKVTYDVVNEPFMCGAHRKNSWSLPNIMG
jgi:hypothetical protein